MRLGCGCVICVMCRCHIPAEHELHDGGEVGALGAHRGGEGAAERAAGGEERGGAVVEEGFDAIDAAGDDGVEEGAASEGVDGHEVALPGTQELGGLFGVAFGAGDHQRGASQDVAIVLGGG